MMAMESQQVLVAKRFSLVYIVVVFFLSAFLKTHTRHSIVDREVDEDENFFACFTITTSYSVII